MATLTKIFRRENNKKIESKLNVCICELISGLCYYCSFTFNENYNLVLREPFNIMNYIDLIAEVRKRPVLWHKIHLKTWNEKIEAWREVALCLGVDIATCKSAWTRLRNVFRKQVKCTYKKIENDISRGKYNPNKNYSKGLRLYNYMKFIDSSPEKTTNNSKLNDSNTGSDIENSDEEFEIEIVIKDSEDENIENSTDENEGITCSKDNKSSVSSDIQIDAIVEELPDKQIEKSPIYDLRTENSTLTDQIFSSNNKIHQEQIMLPEAVIKNEIEDPDIGYVHFKEEKNTSPNNENSPKLTSNSKAQLRETDNIHIKKELDNTELQDDDNIDIKEEFLECEPSNTTSNISLVQRVLRTNNVEAFATNNIDDLDLEFLIGYLPQMKCMSKFQNLVFRAKMSGLIMNILTSGEVDESDSTGALEENVRDIRSRAFADIEDPNWIFLVSFLPYIKSMHLVQNFEFRSNMNDLMHNIFSK